MSSKSNVFGYIHGQQYKENASLQQNGRLSSSDRQKALSLKMRTTVNGTPKRQKTQQVPALAVDSDSDEDVTRQLSGDSQLPDIEGVGDGFNSTISTNFDKTGSTIGPFAGVPSGQGYDQNFLQNQEERIVPLEPNFVPPANRMQSLNQPQYYQSIHHHAQSKGANRFAHPERALETAQWQGHHQGGENENGQATWGYANKRSREGEQAHHGSDNQRSDTDPTLSEDDGYEAEDNVTSVQPLVNQEQQYENDGRKADAKRKAQPTSPKKQGRQSQIAPNVDQEIRLPVRPEIDDGRLKSMTYEEVEKRTPWDPPTDKRPYSIPDFLKDKSFTDRIEYFVKERGKDTLNAEEQLMYYENLTTREWDEAGDYLFSQLGAIFKSLTEARVEKRRLMEKYERALEAREEKVRLECAKIDKDLEAMRNGGEGLIRGRK